MTADPKPLTRKELLAMAREYKYRCGGDAIEGLARTVAALLPAEGGPKVMLSEWDTTRHRVLRALGAHDMGHGWAWVEAEIREVCARAEAAEKRVAELETDLEAAAVADRKAKEARFAAGIREGLERAAVRIDDPNVRRTWLEPRFATALAKEIRAMKEGVK